MLQNRGQLGETVTDWMAQHAAAEVVGSSLLGR
jgi:hypothetical protein